MLLLSLSRLVCLAEKHSEHEALTRLQLQLHAKQHRLAAGCMAITPGCPLPLASLQMSEACQAKQLHHAKPAATVQCCPASGQLADGCSFSLAPRSSSCIRWSYFDAVSCPCLQPPFMTPTSG